MQPFPHFGNPIAVIELSLRGNDLKVRLSFTNPK